MDARGLPAYADETGETGDRALHSPAQSSDEDSLAQQKSRFAMLPEQHTRLASWHDKFLATIRRRRVVAGAVVAAGLVLFVLLVVAVLPGSRQRHHRQLHSPGANDEPQPDQNDYYCTTWPVRRTDDMTFEVPRSEWPSSWLAEKPAANNSLGFRKPRDFKIVALVFYGRQRFVDVLDCYLQRNLVSNGGFLDRVEFLANTLNENDLAWLDGFVEKTPEYSITEVPSSCRGVPFKFDCMWEQAIDTDTMYIKIDDDVVFIDDDAIPNLVKTRLEHKEAFAVGSNLVNSHLMSWPQYHSGAVYPFLPEQEHYERDDSMTWRGSQLPAYEGDVMEEEMTQAEASAMTAPYLGHRWLPLSRNSSAMLYTPMSAVEYSDLRIGVDSWAVAAQQHYSFLDNYENGKLDKYWVGGEGIWHPQYRRYNLNFFAVWGTDVAANQPILPDDEHAFTVHLPKALGRPFLIASHSLVAHFHFGPQTRGVLRTDLLDRYRALANEHYCPPTNIKMPTNGRCPDF